MKIEQVGAITSSIRKYCDDVPAFEDSMKKIRDIGYQAVQISGILHIPVEDVVRVCGDLGLTICATHEPGATVVEDPQSVVEKLKVMGTTLTAYPYPHQELEREEDAHAIAAALDTSGKVLSEAGCTLMYHNHHIEFQRFGDRVALEIIYDETDPAHLQGEPDTHWIQAGGGDPVAWCEKLSGRLPVLHMKDYVINSGKDRLMTSIGSGNLDWKRIVAAADKAGTQWYVVEHDGGTFESLEASFNYIKNELCE